MSPWITVDEPESDVVEKSVPVTADDTICPDPFMTSVPFTLRMESQPEPMFRAYSVAAVPVRAPMFTALTVTSASPVRAPILNMFAVLVPAVALPMVGVIENPWLMFVPAESAGVARVSTVTFCVVPELALSVLLRVAPPDSVVAPVRVLTDDPVWV